MSKRKIERLKLNEKSIIGLKKGGVETCRVKINNILSFSCSYFFLILNSLFLFLSKDLFTRSTIEIMCLADLNPNETEEIIQEASAQIVRHDTLFDLLQRRSLSSSFLQTGIAGFDDILSGGLIVGSITEICGPPGIGNFFLFIYFHKFCFF